MKKNNPAPDGPILFFDTPRGADGRNHVFLASQRGKEHEQRILAASYAARRSPTGKNHLAVSRRVSQLTRGQSRSGDELLVFCGFEVLDEGTKDRLLERLKDMLGEIDQEILDGMEGHGVVIVSPLIGRYEEELLGMQGVSGEKARRNHGKAVFVFCLMLAVLVGVLSAIGLLSGDKDRAGNGRSENGHMSDSGDSEISQPQDGYSNRSETTPAFNARDWEFLNDGEWKQIRSLTGSSSDPIDSTVVDWAERFLREFDPDSRTDVHRLDDELRNNDNVSLLLRSLPPSEGSIDSVATTVTNRWLGLRGHDAISLVEFWKALNNGNPPPDAPAALRVLIDSWWRATDELLENSSELSWNRRGLRETLGGGGLDGRDLEGFRIPSELDLRMFLEVRAILENEGFVGMLQNTASGDNWLSSEWEMRFRKLKVLGTESDIDPQLSAFCRELSAGLDRYKVAVGRP